MSAGRPIEYTPEKIAKIKEKLEKYCNETEIPIIVEFAYQNDIPRETLYEIPELRYTIKKLIAKKETNLERLMLSGKQNVSTGCIFSLKQLGWKEKQEVELSGNMKLDPINVILGGKISTDE